jgi:hypothetical protein
MAMVDVQRPVFFEGQILSAADLTGTVESDRARVARHERTLHEWGISDGLRLTGTRRQAGTIPYVEVTVQPGMAVDGTGRQVVVGDPVPLSTALFKQVNGASLTGGAYYPVVLRGIDDEVAAPMFAMGSCDTGAGARRIAETYEVTFRPSGGAAGLDDQPAPDVTGGPGPLDAPWDILLGFVQWNDTIDQFTAAVDAEPGGAARRYAGVKADAVAARGGRLELRPVPTREAGNVAVVLGGDPPALTFGVYQGDGTVDPRVTITAEGDIQADGVVKGKPSAQEVLVQSGTASDGIVLPLPTGVDPASVDRGAAVLHIVVTPRAVPSAAPAGFPFGPFPEECFADSSRVLHCLVRWMKANGDSQSVPASADYLVVAVGAQSGATP